MRFAYADPPYLGCCQMYGHHHADPYGCWDDPATHRQLIDTLTVDYPDGWALSASSPSLHTILPMCPDGIRVAAWVKPFAAFKRNVRNAYTWEPVIVRGGRASHCPSSGRGWRGDHLHLRQPPSHRDRRPPPRTGHPLRGGHRMSAATRALSTNPWRHDNYRPDMFDDLGPIHRDPAIDKAAALTICDRARDADDARGLLEALGLVEPETPAPKWRRP